MAVVDNEGWGSEESDNDEGEGASERGAMGFCLTATEALAIGKHGAIISQMA